MHTLRSRLRDLSVRAKLGVLLGAMVVALAAELALSLSTVERLRVGSEAYRRIAARRDAIEQVALLEADLASYQAAVLELSQQDRDVVERKFAGREAIGGQIARRFDDAVAAAADPGVRVTLESARATWTEFLQASEMQVVPSLLRGDVRWARELITGVQASRYARFSAQVGAAVSALRAQVGAMEDAAAAEAARRMRILAAGVAALFAAAMLIGWLASRAVTRPLFALTAAANRVATGVIPAERIGIGARDELGRLGAVFDDMMAAIRDLMARAQGAARRLDATAHALLAANRQMSEGAREQAQTLAAVSEDATRMAAALQELSTVADQVSSAASRNVASADAGAHAAQDSAQGLEAIRRASEEVQVTLRGAGEASERIAAVVETLQEVAAETRVLSLNAGIEAARAGEAGKGFGVVAGEVRSLAERAARSAEEIQALAPAITARMRGAEQAVSGNVAAVVQGTLAGAQLARTFEDITHSAQGTNRSVDEMTRVLGDQVSSTRRTADAIGAVARVADEHLSSATRIVALGEELQGVAADLKGLLARFTLEEDGAAPQAQGPGAPTR